MTSSLVDNSPGVATASVRPRVGRLGRECLAGIWVGRGVH
nr:MAG TPA: hypothetical protein [Caudoviricetes sp.]